MDLTDIIRESVDAATEVPEAEGEQVTDVEEGGAPEETAEVPQEEALPSDGKGPTPEELAALDKELESYGLKAPKPGSRDNRIPYSRVRKITENAIKKIREQVKKDGETQEGELKTARERLDNIARTDQLIRTDPQRYLQLLSHIHPQYAEFLTGGKAKKEEEPPEKVKDNDPMPQPDAKFSDGSTGYSMEGLQKLMDWRDRRLEDRVAGKIGKRYEPLENSFKTAQMMDSQARHVNAQIEHARQIWGDKLDTHRDEILALMEKLPQNVPFDAIVSSVLVPKMKAEAEEKVKNARTSVMDELKERPAAAKSPSSRASSGGPEKPLSTEDVIRAELAKIRG